jgi:hypothetical protein
VVGESKREEGKEARAEAGRGDRNREEGNSFSDFRKFTCKC